MLEGECVGVQVYQFLGVYMELRLFQIWKIKLSEIVYQVDPRFSSIYQASWKHRTIRVLARALIHDKRLVVTLWFERNVYVHRALLEPRRSRRPFSIIDFEPMREEMSVSNDEISAQVFDDQTFHNALNQDALPLAGSLFISPRGEKIFNVPFQDDVLSALAVPVSHSFKLLCFPIDIIQRQIQSICTGPTHERRGSSRVERAEETNQDGDLLSVLQGKPSDEEFDHKRGGPDHYLCIIRQLVLKAIVKPSHRFAGPCPGICSMR